jgi:Ca2+-binding EF-hand superfamily protein
MYQEQIELFLKNSDSSQSGDLTLTEFVDYLQKHEKQLRYN